RHPPGRRGEQPLEVPLAVGEARQQPVGDEAATPGQRPPGAEQVPAADAVEHYVHATPEGMANLFQEVKALVVDGVPAEALDNLEFAGGCGAVRPDAVQPGQLEQGRADAA